MSQDAAHKDESSFLREMTSKQGITKDLVMLLFQKEGITPGSLFKAKLDFCGTVDTSNAELTAEDISIINIEGTRKKYINRKRHPKAVSVHKGDIGMFVDVDCEAITSGSTLISVKFLINEKVVNVAYDILDEDYTCQPKRRVESAYKDINVDEWLTFWKNI